jgi:hypothetical protein
MILASPSLSLAGTIGLAFVVGEFVLPDLVRPRRLSRLWSLPVYAGAILWSFTPELACLGLAFVGALAGCDLLETGKRVPATSKMIWGYAILGLRAALLSAVIALVMAGTLAGQPDLCLPAAAVRVILWATAYLFVLPGGTALVRHVLDAASPAWRDRVTRAAAEPPGSELRSGRIIGNLERLIVATLVCLGQYGAIGLVLAAKSLARFPQLSESRDFAEYYLIGTLVSMAVAIGAGLVLAWALGGI